MTRRGIIEWVDVELGKPASEWRVRHWAAMIGIIGALTALVYATLD